MKVVEVIQHYTKYETRESYMHESNLLNLNTKLTRVGPIAQNIIYIGKPLI